jgi:hypothetical protein
LIGLRVTEGNRGLCDAQSITQFAGIVREQRFARFDTITATMMQTRNGSCDLRTQRGFTTRGHAARADGRNQIAHDSTLDAMNSNGHGRHMAIRKRPTHGEPADC